GAAAHLQLPALAARIHRALFHRFALAGFRRGCARDRDCIVQAAREALRSDIGTAAGRTCLTDQWIAASRRPARRAQRVEAARAGRRWYAGPMGPPALSIGPATTKQQPHAEDARPYRGDPRSAGAGRDVPPRTARTW